MKAENTIPAIADPLGRHWRQPPLDEILVDDTHALMSETTFNQLLDYSNSQPSAVKGPNYCSNNFAEILIQK